MHILLICGVLWLIYVYIGYVAVLTVMARWTRVLPNASTDYVPRVSVLIAARNEEKDIGWKIAETLQWNYPSDSFEILIGSDASDDATDAIVRHYPSRQVTLVRMEHRAGKARILNRLAELASGDVLFFTDVNAHVQPESLRSMVRHFADPQVGCVTGHSCSIEELDTSALSRGANAYWRYESFLKEIESSIGSVLVCDGAIFCVRKSLFRQLCPNIANDLEIPMRVAAEGFWVLYEPLAVVLEHESTSAIEEFGRRRRMCAQGMLAMLILPGTLRGLRGFQFVSHKFLRWLSLLPLTMVFIGSAYFASASSKAAVILAVQGCFYGAALLGFALTLKRLPVPRVIAVPFYVVLGCCGSFVGVVESLLGRRFDTWNIPSTSRGRGDSTVIAGLEE
jgi:cellulose synthase/poly-beta-1,6-N-acetylglucosamine synthase-like glycosyltransferase